MFEQNQYDYEKIVGETIKEDYLGPERQGELLKRCTILEDVEVYYSGSTCLMENAK